MATNLSAFLAQNAKKVETVKYAASARFTDAEGQLVTMLTPGEFEDYSAKVLEVNGFVNDAELVDEAKN